MKIIKRDYLKKLINAMGTPDIKVITGIRRSGKSELLSMFKDYVLNSDKDANIIFIDYNLVDFEDLKEYKKLIEYIDNLYNANKNNYIMIDEVQMCDGFEIALNNFHAQKNTIFILLVLMLFYYLAI